MLRFQGRFSGRLTSKEDEERLVLECALLGPLLGGLPGCDGACDTLSRIVRSIACSDLRQHLEAKERTLQVLAVCLVPQCDCFSLLLVAVSVAGLSTRSLARIANQKPQAPAVRTRSA